MNDTAREDFILYLTAASVAMVAFIGVVAMFSSHFLKVF